MTARNNQTNDFSIIFTAHSAGALVPACVRELAAATKAEQWGRVAAIAEMLAVLKGEDVLTETGLILANYVSRAIAREASVEVLAA